MLSLPVPTIDELDKAKSDAARETPLRLLQGDSLISWEGSTFITRMTPMVTFNAGSDPRDVLAPDRLRRMVMVDVTGLASETECRKAARALFDVGSIPILAPASVPPVSAECNEAVQMSADGNASPLLCPNGGVNVPAWNNYTGSYGAILALGPSATESTVISTMCSVSPPYPEIENAGILASHYYGWSFADSTAISDFPFYPSAADNECSS